MQVGDIIREAEAAARAVINSYSSEIPCPLHPVVMEDTLDRRVENAKEELRDYLQKEKEERTASLPEGKKLEKADFEDMSNKAYEVIGEIADSNTPVYTQEIDQLWYLFGEELREAYENVGANNNPFSNNGMSAICYYIEQKLSEYLHEWIDEEIERLED